MIDRLGKPI